MKKDTQRKIAGQFDTLIDKVNGTGMAHAIFVTNQKYVLVMEVDQALEAQKEFKGTVAFILPGTPRELT